MNKKKIKKKHLKQKFFQTLMHDQIPFQKNQPY